MDFSVALKQTHMFAILRGVEEERLIPTVKALAKGGIKAVEITFDRTGEIPDTQIAKNISALCTHLGNEIAVGAGTVLNKNQVLLAAKAGACFIVSPNTDASVINCTKKAGLFSVPGAMTPTEIACAHSLGADAVKVFPCDVLGSKYIKAVSAPLKGIPLVAAGGINEDNIPEYLSAGAAGVAVASCVIKSEWVNSAQYDKIAEKARELTALVRGE